MVHANSPLPGLFKSTTGALTTRDLDFAVYKTACSIKYYATTTVGRAIALNGKITSQRSPHPRCVPPRPQGRGGRCYAVTRTTKSAASQPDATTHGERSAHILFVGSRGGPTEQLLGFLRRHSLALHYCLLRSQSAQLHQVMNWASGPKNGPWIADYPSAGVSVVSTEDGASAGASGSGGGFISPILTISSRFSAFSANLRNCAGSLLNRLRT